MEQSNFLPWFCGEKKKTNKQKTPSLKKLLFLLIRLLFQQRSRSRKGKKGKCDLEKFTNSKTEKKSLNMNTI
jgi:predicted nucleotidyltransferase